MNLNQKELELLGQNIQIQPPKSEYLEIEGIGKIDISIASLIHLLNQIGFITLASCSGLDSEHIKKGQLGGYITFDVEKSDQKLDDLSNIARSLGMKLINEGDCYFRKALTLRIAGFSELELKEKWKDLNQELINYSFKR